MADGSDLHAARVAAFQDAVLAAWREDRAPPPARFPDGVWRWIERNHVCNTLRWRTEQRSRRGDVPDAEVAGCKRTIDRQNHARHQAIELIDASMLDLFAAAGPGARLHVDTPGTMIDRLSSLSLQISHARHAAEDGGDGERDPRLAPAVKRLAAERRDLCDCLDRLLREMADGLACFHLYGEPPLELRTPNPLRNA
jgi:hypothetical protein